MSKLVLANLDLNGNQILGLRVEVLASDPAGGGLYEGRLWFNSTTDLLKYYNGSAVVSLGTGGGVSSLTVDNASIENIGDATDPSIRVKALGITNAMLAGSIANSKLATDPLARGNHTGTQAAATISDLATVVKAYRLDEFAVPTADVSLNSHKLTNVTDPSSAQDAATKNYVDAVAAGLAPKDAVRVSSTAAITLATGAENGDTLDGVTLATGDRILLRHQAAPAENGIYVVAASGAPTRATDADSSADLLGAAVFVSEGTTWGNTLWVMTTDGPITVDTTGLVWAQFGGPGEYTASNGVTKTGSDFAIENSGVLTVAHGGTGAATAAAALAALGGVGRYATDIGDGAATSYVLTHGLTADKDKVVLVRQNASPYAEVLCDVEFTSTTTITLKFAVAPTSNQYRAVVIG